MNLHEPVEPTPISKKETIRRQKRERAKSELDGETLNQENFHKMRLIDDDGNLDSKPSANSDGNSLAGSEKLGHHRIYRTLSLNIERNETNPQEYKPFVHKELYPYSVQKYLALSQKSKQFVMTEALSTLRMPNNKTYPKALDKMRLLGLVQEREIESHLRSRMTNSSLGTPSSENSPLVNGSPVNRELSNTDDQAGPKPSIFLQMAQQNQIPSDSNEMLMSNISNVQAPTNQQQSQPDFYGRTTIDNNQVSGNSPQGFRVSMQGTNILGSQPSSGHNWNQYPGPMQGSMPVYPQQQFSQYSYQHQHHQQQQQQQLHGYPKFHANQPEQSTNPKIQENPIVIDLTSEPSDQLDFPRRTEIIIDDTDDFPAQNRMNQQGGTLQIPMTNLNPGYINPNSMPSQPLEGSQQGGTSLKDFADQQLFKINNLLVQKPKKLYRLNSNEGTSAVGTSQSNYQHSPSLNSPKSPMSDSSVNNHLNFSTFNVALSTSTNKSNESSLGGNGINSLSSIKTDEYHRNTLFPPDPTNIANLLVSPSKKNKKAFQRMNTDPTQLDSLMKTINTPSPNSNSPHHSKNPSFGGAYQNPPPLSQFGMSQGYSGNSNPNNSTLNTFLGGGQTSGSIQFPSMLGSNIPKSLQVARLGTTSITETLAENLPGSPKKKTRGFGRYNTDPTQTLNQLANTIVSTHPGPYYMTEGFKAQIPEYSSYNTVDNPSTSFIPEDSKSSTDALNERMDQMTLRSDQMESIPTYSHAPNFSNFNANFQPKFTEFAYPVNENQYPQTHNQQSGFPSSFNQQDFIVQPSHKPQNPEENWARLIDTDNFLDLQPNANKSDTNKGQILDPDSFLS